MLARLTNTDVVLNEERGWKKRSLVGSSLVELFSGAL